MTVDDELIDRMLSGEPSDEEAAAFQQWVKTPANLQRFALRAELHAELRHSLRRRHIQARALEANRVASAIAPAWTPQQDQTPVFRSPKRLLAMATGLVTAACLLVAFLWPHRSVPPAPGDRVTASVVRNVSGVLTKAGQKWDDPQLPAGDYQLQAGLLNLRFGGGVMVYVEAPARFDAVSDRRVMLYSGRLSATVPPEGIGFTVETPEAEVIDFGTEFSIDVEGGASEVHVFDGLVRVNPGTSNQRDASKSVDLHASEAVRITGGAPNPVGISVETNRFIRNFDELRLNYARAIKRLSPVAYYRMPIRDRGLVSEPPTYSGVVLTGEGKRPPHAKGVFAGGSLRVGIDSIGRGGRVDSPPSLSTGQFSLTVFVYLEVHSQNGVVATNFDGERGNFGLSLDENAVLQATIRTSNVPAVVDDVTSPVFGGVVAGSGLVTSSTTGGSVLPQKTWRHIVVTADGRQLQLYEDGKLISSKLCSAVAASEFDTLWFGTDASAKQLWGGRIDELALFDRALNEEEIAALYRTAQEELARSQ
ncbi:FecR protein domain protein [Rhodopirellula maiorica SM1]|uniref:FecR protein domain protein n=1 Tax=Rhodopirellula maiorica SM1 TaxID=1265738 RepID=M5RFR3_9BACT|nr:LamG-like jellyroll fold domain-containing protein [Rhodopirellula maiorica]EMI18220.1 FecR protein domain protein [Rhodopirellula maiorica SM1]